MSMEVHIMNKKVLSLGVMLSLVTTGAFAADAVSYTHLTLPTKA